MPHPLNSLQQVINNKWVKVQLNSGAMDSEVLWFSIGSVDTLERNLENAQNDLGIEVGAAGFVKL